MKLGVKEILSVAFLFLLGHMAFSQNEIEPNDSPSTAQTVSIFGPSATDFNGNVIFSVPTDTVDYWNIPDSASWTIDTSFLGDLRLVGIDSFGIGSYDYRIELRQYIGATRASAVLDTTIIIPKSIGATVQNINRRNYHSIVIKNLSGTAGIYSLDFIMVQGAANGSGSLGLPVEWLNFEATLKDQQIHLYWQTATEENNRGFYVERSSDALHWEELGFIEGAGTTEEFRDYSFIDPSPSIGYNYYRIRQEDFNGDTDYSDIREVVLDPGTLVKNFRVYPNPTTEFIRVSPIIGQYRILDLQGRVLQHSHLNGSTTKLSLSSFSRGTYIFELLLPDQPSQIHRIVKQ